MSITPAELVHRTAHHPPPNSKVAEMHGHLRTAAREMMMAVAELVPEGREQSLAITKIEEAMMWANAGIGRGYAT